MIIIDYSSIQYGALHQIGNQDDKDIFRHMVLNSLRMYAHKYKNRFGNIVLAVDSTSWRKEEFPYYKGARKKNRDNNKELWKARFNMFNQIVDEFREHLIYPIIQVERAEADDIIGTLTESYYNKENIMIISADKDMGQLQRYPGVRQHSPQQKKEIKIENPDYFLFEHIVKGDSGDGIPNIRSHDGILMEEGSRQNSILKKFKEKLWNNRLNISDHLTEDEFCNFKRNELLIDLTKTPIDIKKNILEEYRNSEGCTRNKFMQYLINNRCKQLIKDITQF